MKEATLLVKEIDSRMGILEYNGDWIDLRVSKADLSDDAGTEKHRYVRDDNTVLFRKGDSIKISFGIAIELPRNHEAIIKPRGSLFRKTGLIFTSSGVIDEGYRGNEDEWFAYFYATKDVEIKLNERYCQFRIYEKQPQIDIRYTEYLGSTNRGGDGSTGRF